LVICVVDWRITAELALAKNPRATAATTNLDEYFT
jgi:hypothetical protein